MSHKFTLLLVTTGFLVVSTTLSLVRRTAQHLEEFERTTARHARCARLGGTLIPDEHGSFRCVACSTSRE